MTSGQLSILSEHEFGNITARYVTNDKGCVGLWLYPTSAAGLLAERRATVADESWVRNKANAKPAIVVEPLVHVKIVGDDQPGQFGPGRTLLWSPSNDKFSIASQHRDKNAVITTFTDSTGLSIEHRLSAGPRDLTLRSDTSFLNESDRPVRLELLTSFALSGITPFSANDAPNRLEAHRFRAVWSAEGRLVSDSIEHLHLERVYAGGMKLSERFGQVGSMPVRGWFPTALVEDTEAGVVWGARVACPTSWQLEFARRYDDLTLAGGYADREFAHWTKTVQRGEKFNATPAWLTCVSGTVDDACDRLVSVDVPAVESQPAIERDLPIVYNDWCTSWGAPREDKIFGTADRLGPLGVRYLVIDAGWYMPETPGAHWATTMGDWQANKNRFPRGLAATAAGIRARGLIPGLWMEPEHDAKDSAAFHEIDHLLRRDGQTLTLELRRAWDLHDPWVRDFIDERVIRPLADAGFRYLKIDYSETLGIGVDHFDGLGEGLRRHGEGTHALFDRIRSALPEMVTELVSAGGGRMEPSLLQRTSMASSSDGHETVEIPIISAALHRLVLPRQSLIWAVLNSDDSLQRLGYTLAATFLGRMCLSGDLVGLGDAQLAFVKSATELYRRCVPVIRDGMSRIMGEIGPSWRHPTGWQGVVRSTPQQVLVVFHSFKDSPTTFTLPLPSVDWKVVGALTSLPVILRGSMIEGSVGSDFSAQVILLEEM
ncbi:family 36 glycoside hydrolase [Clohesyomyces aquaticus]|uniref:alpha-galactosidase n=1 Tax=Clohesyomyces aquaticus TaxID=1231657 RepID=A0A1Y1Y8S3_9PLEO|nr:family 36 glycoside hydrolase [Clohesyomyces aquaticus]